LASFERFYNNFILLSKGILSHFCLSDLESIGVLLALSFLGGLIGAAVSLFSLEDMAYGILVILLASLYLITFHCRSRFKLRSAAPAIGYVPWRSPMAPVSSSVIVVSPYWWSFFTTNSVPATLSSSSTEDPPLPAARKPPDLKPSPNWRLSTLLRLATKKILSIPGYGFEVFVSFWSRQGRQTCIEAALITLALGLDYVPVRRLLTAGMVHCIIGTLSVVRIALIGATLFLPLVWFIINLLGLMILPIALAWVCWKLAQWCLRAVLLVPIVIMWLCWKGLQWGLHSVLMGLACIEGYIVRPAGVYLGTVVLLALHGAIVFVDYVVLLLQQARLVLSKGIERGIDLHHRQFWSPKPLRQYRQRKHREVRKRARAAARTRDGVKAQRRLRIRTVLLAMMSIPNVLTSSEKIFSDSLVSFCTTDGHLLTDRLPKERLVALRGHLSSFEMTSGNQDLLRRSATVPTVVDSGASACSTDNKNDFVPGTYTPIFGKEMAGIASSLPVVGKGVLRYEAIADDGDIAVLEVWGYYIPDLPIRLMSPQVHLRDSEGKERLFEFGMRAEASVLRLTNGRTITVPYNASSRLPILYVSTDMKSSSLALEASLSAHVAGERNQNLSGPQRVLLQWHQKLGHVGYTHLTWLAAKGYLGHGAKCIADLQATDKKPLCGSCIYGTQERKATGAHSTPVDRTKIGSLSKGVIVPGQVTGMDQYVQTTPGRGPSVGGLSTTQSQRLTGGTIFVDVASGRVQVHHQHSLNAHETLVSKAKYEQNARLAGVSVTGYHADNGIFTAGDFTRQIWDNGQSITYSGVGAKHQNGISERAIKTVTYMARTSMLHSAIHWPEVYSAELWPFAMTYAAHVYNSIPRMGTGCSAEELFTGVKVDHAFNMSHMVPWGIPAYVLQPKLQDGGSIPKWKPRSRRGQFLGVSPVHCQKSVGLIRNLVTNRVSPQFHVVYDSWFETTYAPEGKPPDAWQDLTIYSKYRCEFDFGISLSPQEKSDLHKLIPDLHPEWLDSDEIQSRNAPSTQFRQRQQRKHPTPAASQQRKTNTPSPRPSDGPTDSPEEAREEEVEIDTNADATASLPLRRSTRQVRPVDSLTYDVLGGYAATRECAPGSPALALHNDLSYMNACLFTDPEEGTIEEYLHGVSEGPWSLVSKKADDPDLPTWSKAMSGPHRDEFLAGQHKELNQLRALKCWNEVPRSSVPRHMNIIKSTWAFKIARLPSGEIKKFKSRFCARGDTQVEGVDVFETYAPVAQWSTIRMLLTMAVQRNLKTRALDISNAFVTAPLEPDEHIYVEMPRGHTKPDTVYKLNKSLYGLRQSPKKFFEFLRDKLVDGLGFVQSDHDKCLFIRGDVLLVVYVDDALIFAKDSQSIDQVITDLEAEFTLTKDEPDQDAFAYLGLELRREEKSDGQLEITLVQPGLINKILDKITSGKIVNGRLLSVHETDTRKEEITPAGSVLGAAKGTIDFNESEFGFSYRSAIGMLMYLVNTRPDLQTSVHQCARFSHAPKESHGKAIRRIARYLKATRDKGLILRPTNGPITFDCFVDADFAGLFGHEDPQDPVSVKSRTGYVFTLGENPIHWVSKLQPSISLSTVEAEYVALSMALREFIVMRRVAQEICKTLNVDVGRAGTIKSTVFEDNNGALSLATKKRMNPRTKHIGVIYHWFWDHVGEGTDIKIEKIDTTIQLGDMFTKPLERLGFERIRKLIMGW
jgi:hypothetical protein